MKRKQTDELKAAKHRRKPLSRRKKILFAAIATMLFFAASELCLYLAGIQPAIERDPFVGFAKHLPLFVESSDKPGIVHTAPNKLRWFNEQAFARKKPANTYRIFCLGGSTTYGRPYDDSTSFSGWLRELLPAADSSKRWEVINAGGISYASYRVALVLEEIVEYQPDLVVVYTGHNEFLEHRTYDKTNRRSAFTKTLHRAFGRTRIYAAMERLRDVVLRSDPSSTTAGDVPESATNMLPAEVATKLDQGVGPDAYTRDDELRDHVVEHFRLNLRRMVSISQTAGADIVFVTPASNLRDCSPFKSETTELTDIQRDQFLVALEKASSLLSQAQEDDALVAVDTALQIDSRHAAAHFLRGQVLSKLQRFEEAKESFDRALEEDVCPLRAVSEFPTVLNRLATEQAVSLIDFRQIVDAHSPNRIPGENVFLDHVHPTIEGHRLLAISILELMIAKGHVQTDSGWGESAIERVRRTVEGRVDQEANGIALRNLAKVLAWAGKQDEADRLAVRAANLLQDDMNAQYLAGSALIEQGDCDQAITKLQQVIQSEPNHAMAVLSLGAAYQKKSMFTEAERQFRRVLELQSDNAAAHNNLGALCIRTRRWDEAKVHLTKAIESNPRYAKAFHNLGIVSANKQDAAEAIQNLLKAVEINPDLSKAHEDLGNLYRAQKDIANAISHYRQALRSNSNLLMTANSLAWLLATTRDDELRDGEEALRWALRCGAGTNYRNPGVFNTLAAAYAETGDFDKAVEWQKKALASAPESMKSMCKQRIELYSQHKALRQ